MKIISYIVTALFILVGGFALTYFVQYKSQKEEMTRISADLDSTKGQLATSIQTVARIEQEVSASELALTGLADKVSVIGDKGSEVATRIYTLERNNEKIRELLSTRLPEHGCLLDDTCSAPSGDGLPNTESATDTTNPL